MTTKTFDAVAMKHRGAALVREKLAGLSRDEELTYWARATEQLRDRQRSDAAAARSALRALLSESDRVAIRDRLTLD